VTTQDAGLRERLSDRLVWWLTQMDQRIRFCEAAGSRVAFATAGQGPALVVDTGWVGHLEFMWQSPAYRTFFESLAQTHTIIRFDKPGTGLSDRQRRDFSIEVEVQALEGVIASLGLRTFDVLGTSQGGLVAALIAHRHPQRVRRLVLYGTWACGQELAPDEVKSSVLALIRAHWGLGSRTLSDIFLAGEDAAAAVWFAESQRISASAQVAADLLEECYRTDIGEILPTLTVPTLVLHRQEDLAVPFRLGREVAAHIPGARLVPLRGMAHLPYFGETEPLLGAIRGFLTKENQAVLPLSPREREVVALVAGGLTNREIAEVMVISQRTAENHLQRVLNRLGLRSRAQVVAWAIEHGFTGSLSTLVE
jgi:pimeloyl-ACP methyl ester carboxylesterase/DNA-binding CsgD family transcriptional regulator